MRRTFREYVTGSIGQGKWTLADGAQDGGALFRFPQGKGTYDAKKQTLDAGFSGSVRFTGAHDLDLTFAAVTVAVTQGKGTLSADVTSGGTTTKGVPIVTFTAEDFAPKDGLAALTEAPATLTAEGSKAFNSMYKAGTAMDPVSLAVAVDEKAQLPALPDLGSEPTAAAAEPVKKAAEKPSAAPAAASSDSGLGAKHLGGHRRRSAPARRRRGLLRPAPPRLRSGLRRHHGLRRPHDLLTPAPVRALWVVTPAPHASLPPPPVPQGDQPPWQQPAAP